MSLDQVGKLVIMLGLAGVVLGIVLVLFGRAGLSKLPGDISLTTGNFTCVVPVVSMIVLSLLLTLILNIVLRIFNR